MKALRLHELGGPEKLVIDDIATPQSAWREAFDRPDLLLARLVDG